MAPFEDDTDQMSFADLKHMPKPGKRVHDLGIRVIEDTASPNTGSAERNRKVLKLRWLLWDYVRSHGVGHEFQAIDFSHHAAQQPQYESDINLKSSGGMFKAMVNAGVLEQIGFRNNGGNKETGYHGTPRAVYRVTHLDFSLLGWPEDLSGIEQDGVWTDDSPPRRKASA